MAARWNHNLHHHPVVLGAIPPGVQRALDAGCGEGVLTRKLRERVPEVVGVDRDAASIDLARRADPGGQYVLGDLLTEDLGSFDFVASVAALHHMDEAAALRRMAQLLRPGGVLAVIGLARSRYPRDLARDGLAVGLSRAVWLMRGRWESPAPTVWPPPHTYAQAREIALRELPGAVFRRYLLFRYSIVWTRTTGG